MIVQGSDGFLYDYDEGTGEYTLIRRRHGRIWPAAVGVGGLAFALMSYDNGKILGLTPWYWAVSILGTCVLFYAGRVIWRFVPASLRWLLGVALVVGACAVAYLAAGVPAIDWVWRLPS